ncbi:hypothetical protein SNK04_013866 [Fusarium graminearum]
MISNKTKGNYWGAAYATFKMVDTPGYFVHQWNVRLKDVIPTNYWILIFEFATLSSHFLKSPSSLNGVDSSCRKARAQEHLLWGCMVIDSSRLHPTPLLSLL